MSKPILDPKYWAERLAEVDGSVKEHYAVYCCHSSLWKQINERHRKLLAAHIKPTDSVLDAGCGWGRLIDLMPVGWVGSYLGIDLCPEFVRKGEGGYGIRPDTQFVCGDLLECLGDIGDGPDERFDWGVGISLRQMIVGNCGEELWNRIEAAMSRACRTLLLLEYDPEGGAELRWRNEWR